MSSSYNPLKELILFRLRTYLREPAAVFWGYGFPIVLTIALGIAFRNKPPEQFHVSIIDNEYAQAILDSISNNDEKKLIKANIYSEKESLERLRLGKSVLVVTGSADQNKVHFQFDPTRQESLFARETVDHVIQVAAGREDIVEISSREITEPGARYIDFLLPGLLGMNLMGSGLWGVGFVTVDLRVRKLLKRFHATPMKKSHFMWSMIAARMCFAFPEVFIVLLAGVFIFDVPVTGGFFSILVVTVAGGVCFAGLGLLVACRAQRMETVSGLMNLIMLPMWLLSGIFFNTENFPDSLQYLVNILPLTHLINAFRAIMLEGASLASQTMELAILLGVGVLTLSLSIKWFRWT